MVKDGLLPGSRDGIVGKGVVFFATVAAASADVDVGTAGLAEEIVASPCAGATVCEGAIAGAEVAAMLRTDVTSGVTEGKGVRTMVGLVVGNVLVTLSVAAAGA